MDLALVDFKEAAQRLQEVLLLVEFLAYLLAGRQLGQDPEHVEHQVIGSGEHLDELGPGVEAVAPQEQFVAFLLGSHVSGGGSQLHQDASPVLAYRLLIPDEQVPIQ